jgi:hypothetical protein
MGSRGALTSRARRGTLRPRPKSVPQPGVPAMQQGCSIASYLPGTDRALRKPPAETYFKFFSKITVRFESSLSLHRALRRVT